MGYLTSFIHFGKTEMPKEADIVNINPYDFEVGEDLRSLLSGMTI